MNDLWFQATEWALVSICCDCLLLLPYSINNSPQNDILFVTVVLEQSGSWDTHLAVKQIYISRFFCLFLNTSSVSQNYWTVPNTHVTPLVNSLYVWLKFWILSAGSYHPQSTALQGGFQALIYLLSPLHHTLAKLVVMAFLNKKNIRFNSMRRYKDVLSSSHKNR